MAALLTEIRDNFNENTRPLPPMFCNIMKPHIITTFRQRMNLKHIQQTCATHEAAAPVLSPDVSFVCALPPLGSPPPAWKHGGPEASQEACKESPATECLSETRKR